MLSFHLSCCGLLALHNVQYWLVISEYSKTEAKEVPVEVFYSINNCQEFSVCLGIKLFSVSEGAACVANHLSVLGQGSSGTNRTCIYWDCGFLCRSETITGVCVRDCFSMSKVCCSVFGHFHATSIWSAFWKTWSWLHRQEIILRCHCVIPRNEQTSPALFDGAVLMIVLILLGSAEIPFTPWTCPKKVNSFAKTALFWFISTWVFFETTMLFERFWVPGMLLSSSAMTFWNISASELTPMSRHL